MSRSLLTIGDLDATDLASIIDRARALRQVGVAQRQPFVASTLFLSSSLRTRAGFSTAVHRLGGSVVDVFEPRFDGSMSDAESLDDTLETLAGISDVLVVRAPAALRELVPRMRSATPVVNAGDDGHHPSQALIDWFAITELAGGDPERTRIALVGDLTMRAARSFLDLAAILGIEHLALVAPPSRLPDVPRLPDALMLEPGELAEFAPDVVSMIGLPPARGGDFLDETGRRPYVLDTALLDALPDSTVVLSPMPVIDEITTRARADRRVRMHDQNSLGVLVRVAVLEMALDCGPRAAAGMYDDPDEAAR